MPIRIKRKNVKSYTFDARFEFTDFILLLGLVINNSYKGKSDCLFAFQLSMKCWFNPIFGRKIRNTGFVNHTLISTRYLYEAPVM